MVSTSEKYFRSIILIASLFALLINFGTTVSGSDDTPLILIDYGNGLDFPMCARRSSTGYVSNDSLDFTKQNAPGTRPVYYCPRTSNSCLVESPVYLKCVKEVKPSIQTLLYDGKTIRCGITEPIYSSNSKLFMVGYNICGLNGEKDSMKEIYRFCFDKNSLRYNHYISYVEYRIISPTLLQNDALKEERFFEYSFTDKYNESKSDYNQKDFEDLFRSNKLNYKFYSTNETPKEFKPTTLASTNDMPFRLLRKPFYQFLNVIFSFNEKVIEEWNKIGTYIRNKAAQLLGQVKIVAGEAKVKEKNNISEVLRSHEPDSSEIIWKVVYSEQEYFAIAIIIHYPFDWQTPPTKLCERSLCDEYGWTNMISDHLKPYVYCCHSEVITKAFRLKEAPFVLNLEENFQSLYHMSEAGCHVKNLHEEPALINIYNWRKIENKNSIPVCATQLPPSNETVYTEPSNADQRNEYYCPPATEISTYLQQMNHQDNYTGCLFSNPGKYQYCARPVQPVLVPKEDDNPNVIEPGCDLGAEHSQLYRWIYKLCRYDDRDGLEFERRVTVFDYPTPIYTVCYNHEFQTTAYIGYRIHSPRLLKNHLLEKEWNYDEKLKTDSYNIEQFNDDFEIMKKSYDNMAPKDEFGFSMTTNFLVPPEDLAFRVWKRAAFHYINVKLMWPYWIGVWDSINQYLRAVATETFWEMEIKTGVLLNEDQLSKSTIWWKIIHYEYERAIAIILHNVPLNTRIKPLCAPKFCQTHNWNFMVPDNKRDYVYCCHPNVITEKLKVFPFPNVLNRNDIPKFESEYKKKAVSCENIPPLTLSYDRLNIPKN